MRLTFRDSRFCIGSALLVGVGLSALLVGFRGIPVPHFQDEFAYLLAADTFASGRMTNPTHPMWEHMESFHIIHQPTYQAKYPPAQGLALALGQRLGHPVLGVCLTLGVAMAAVVWMLIGWLPPKMYWLAWLMTVVHPGMYLMWGYSYWGGAVPLTGAAMVLGAFIRLREPIQVRYVLVGVMGAILLANSRPFEGAVLVAAVAMIIVAKVIFGQLGPIRAVAIKLVAPAALLGAIGIAAMLTYNVNVTGSPWTMPYQVHERTYGWNPLFVWQQAGDPPVYRHPEIETFYRQEKESTEQAYATLASTLAVKGPVVWGLLEFAVGPLAILGLLGLPWLFRQRRYQIAMALLLPTFAAAIASKWANYHYIAPAMPLLLLISVGGVAIWYRKTPTASRRKVVAGLVAVQLGWCLLLGIKAIPATQYRWSLKREAIARQLRELPGQDLVLVRYTADHIGHHEWVYNRADIDRAEIVWVRYPTPESQPELLEYFGNRQAWVLDADAEPPLLQPLAAFDPVSGARTPSAFPASVEPRRPRLESH